MARTSPPVHTPPIHTVTLPHYQVRSAPDHLAIGEVLDRAICRLVHEAAGPAERRVAIRAVSLIDHPGMSHDDLTATIVATGTDRYDPARVGPLDHVYGPYGVELHAIPCTVSPAGLRSVHSSGPSVMAEVVSDFYLGPPVDRGGVPLRVDVVTVYDLRMLEGLVIPFHGDEPEPTAYRFRRPASDRPHPRNWRAQAVLGVLQVR
ncbi:hypothetical protein [Thermasporomyces composti]|uniref:Uncharacterized protein n=1 Tax=Thermasporomyces composti TaxID=696763 RepID=A0A3D9UZS5_THECX|nr:hypothetical protein [Thermasporomyces composti]REF35008.1 hypothetical protein DFJ64_0377 [Thermasporomyces composti]